MRANKYGGKCIGCGKAVAAQAGYCHHDGQRWRVLCRSAACARAAGVDVDRVESAAKAKAEGERTLRMVGRRLVIRSPYDKAALPLLRSLPGARWDREQKAWTASADLEDRARVLEIADQLGLEVEPALRNTGIPTAEAARARAEAIPTVRPYQVAGIEWLAGRQQALLGDDMGLGKTLQILVALPEHARAIAIVPKSVKYTWRDEAARWRPDLTVTPLAGRGSFRLPAPSEVVTVNFDILPSLEQIAEMDLAGITLIVDEAQGVKNYRAKRSQKVQALSKGCGRTWLLTGTPLMNKPPDLYGLLEAGGMGYRTFGSFKRFAERMGGWRGQYGWEWPDYKADPGAVAAEIPEMLKRVMLRRTKAEVLPDLPRKVRTALHVNGENVALRKRLDALWAEWQATIEDGELPPFESFSAVRADLAAARIPAMLEQVEAYEDAGNPLIVFSAHRAPIDTLAERDGWAAITGDTDGEERSRIVADFQAGRLAGVALTIAAGGVGITLTRASHVLFVDWPWRPADISQAEDRACRIGQTADSVQVVTMVQDHPMERAVHALIQAKQEMIERAVEATYQYHVPAKVNGTAPGPVFDAETDEERDARIAEAAERIEREAHAEKVDGVLQRNRGRGFDRCLADLTDERRKQIVDAYSYMLSVCDGARRRDNAGFNAMDARVAHMIGAFDLDSDADLLALWGLLGKYRRQCETVAPALY